MSFKIRDSNNYKQQINVESKQEENKSNDKSSSNKKLTPYEISIIRRSARSIRNTNPDTY